MSRKWSGEMFGFLLWCKMQNYELKDNAWILMIIVPKGIFE